MMTRFLQTSVFALLVACSGKPTTTTTPTPVTPDAATGTTDGAKTACDAGDQPIASQTACLQDDAACYQLVDQTWCTGARPSTGNGGA
jgi:curli biogenesis system outer membrane secretion channel CsgG